MEGTQKITACAFLHKDGKLFIAKRALTKKFLPDHWELPGGHIEFGETIEEGLKREFLEEFHIEVEVGDPFYAFTYTRQDNSTHVVELIYLATLASEKEKIQLNPKDHSEYRWITADEVQTYLDPASEETKAVHKGFKLIAA